jgi:hypothetical protein
MKKIGEYTLRGIIPEATTEEMIRLFDGRFDTGYRVVEFIVWESDVSSSSNDCCARLSTEPLGPMPSSGDMMNAGDNRQIAWAGIQAGTAGFNNPASIVDPDNMIIEDLYIAGQSGGSSININYLIKMEKYEISDWQGALAMVRNRSQT